LHASERVAQLVRVRLAEVAAQQCVLRIERNGDFDLAAAFGEAAFESSARA
jgi:hypothetical protein